MAIRIFEQLGREKATLRDIADAKPEEVLKHSFLIFGIPTWGIGELQDDWAGFLPGLENLDLSGKIVALFGLGDQESYPDTFSDALGTLYDALSQTGCRIIGSWSTLGYEFIESSAVRNGMFAGLVLDEENQPEMTELRLRDWLNEVMKVRGQEHKN